MTKSKNFVWMPGDPPPPIEPHSIAKLDVLHGYLTRYIETLGSNARMPILRLDIVDGFAGGGLFTEKSGAIRLGSPLTFLESIEAARVSISEKRGRPLEIQARYFFIDSSKQAIDYLRDTLISKGYKREIDKTIFLIHAEFIEVYDKVISKIKTRSNRAKAIFLLDQCGYSDAPLDVLAFILSKLPRSEIILNFATDSLLSYLTDSEAFRQALTKAAISESILEDDTIKGKEKGWRFVAERELSRELKQGSGARYYTPFYIVSEESHRAYWLVHLCMHPKAHDEMVKTHWQVGNLFRHYGSAGTKMQMWGYSAKSDPDLSGILDFGFDEMDKDECIRTLNADLPELVYSQDDGIRFSDLMGMIANNTVASEEMIKERLGFLQQEDDLEIITPNQNQRTVSLRISPDDILRKRKQLRLFYSKK